MRKLLILYIFTLTLTHQDSMNGGIGYMFCAVVIGLILGLERKLFFTKNYAYNFGALLFLGSGLYAAVTMGNTMSIAYVVFMTINIMLLPGYLKYKIPLSHIAVFATFLLLSVCFITDLSNPKGNTIYGNMNNYATVTLCCSYFVLLACKDRPLLQVLSFPLLFYLLLISQSRTQLTSLVILYGFYFGQRYVLRTHLRRTTFFIIIVMFFMYGTLITGDPFGIISVVQENTHGHKSYRGLSYRDVLFFASIDILAKYPQGVGWSLAGEYIVHYMGEKLSPHNTYMKIAVEGGWFALAGYLIIFFEKLWRSMTPLVSSFTIAMTIRALFESSTPFTLSFVSVMLILPFFLNEKTIETPEERRLRTINV